jgi:iron(III) transport system permease protein
MPLPDGVRRAGARCLALPWLLFTVVVYVFAFIGGFVQTWGRDYTPTLAHYITAFDAAMGRVRPAVGRHGLELAVHHAQAGQHRRAALRRDRPAHQPGCWRAQQFVGQRAFEFGALLSLRDSGHGARRELHPGLQRAAVRADRHRR